jgi:hypothetical protein
MPSRRNAIRIATKTGMIIFPKASIIRNARSRRKIRIMTWGLEKY